MEVQHGTFVEMALIRIEMRLQHGTDDTLLHRTWVEVQHCTTLITLDRIGGGVQPMTLNRAGAGVEQHFSALIALLYNVHDRGGSTNII